jgi:RNA polymerase sigma-70 factor (ECF subfamily)
MLADGQRLHWDPATLGLVPAYKWAPRRSAATGGRRGALMDREIGQHLAAGRHDRAFDLIVAGYRDRVFRLALSILRERTAAEDAAQETFVRVWKALPRFDGRAALGTWIYAITRNTCLMDLRKRRPTVSLDDPDSPDAQHAAVAAASGPAQDPERGNLLRLVAQLPRNQQEAVRLFYLEDRSYEVVAESLGMPLGTVKNLLHRARKRLVELARPEEVKAA